MMTTLLMLALCGGLWRRWLGSEKTTGRRSVKVIIGFAVAWVVLWLPLLPLTLYDVGAAAAVGGALLLIFVLGLNWLDPAWTAARWAGSAVPLAGALWLAGAPWGMAVASVAVAAAAGLWWLALRPFNNALPTWRPGGMVVFEGYTSYAEFLSGATLWAYAGLALWVGDGNGLWD